MTPSDIVARLESISSLHDISQLQLLESLYKELSPNHVTDEVYRAVLHLFERFPDDDGYESFWSFLHVLEKCRQFEQLLVESVQRTPALVNLHMVDRLLSGGYASVCAQDLRALLIDALRNPRITPENRAFIEESIDRHTLPKSGA